MKMEKEETWSRPFVLTADEIKKIVKHFAHADKIIFKVTCNDKATREFASVAELLNFENVPGKEIKSLGINVFSGYRVVTLINFAARSFYNVKINVEGEEANVSKTIEYFQERLHAIKPWYSFMHRSTKVSYIIDVLIQLILLAPLFKIFYPLIYAGLGNNFLNYLLIFMPGLIVINMLTLWIWGKIKDYAFPSGVFAIGQGMKRHIDKENIRNTVIIGSLVSLVTSIVVTIMFGEF